MVLLAILDVWLSFLNWNEAALKNDIEDVDNMLIF
jgi:hypothetical protein